MPKKTKQKNKPASGFISRTRIIVITLILIVLAGGFSVYALSNYQSKVVTIIDVPTVQTSDSDKLSGTSTVVTDTSKTPVTTPTPVVTPAPSSEVLSLAPTGTQSNSTTTYQSTNWAGYISTGGSFTAVSGTWATPSPTPTSTTVESGDGTWIGIGGITTSDLIQIGTENTISPSGIISSTFSVTPS